MGEHKDEKFGTNQSKGDKMGGKMETDRKGAQTPGAGGQTSSPSSQTQRNQQRGQTERSPTSEGTSPGTEPNDDEDATR